MICILFSVSRSLNTVSTQFFDIRVMLVKGSTTNNSESLNLINNPKLDYAVLTKFWSQYHYYSINTIKKYYLKISVSQGNSILIKIQFSLKYLLIFTNIILLSTRLQFQTIDFKSFDYYSNTVTLQNYQFDTNYVMILPLSFSFLNDGFCENHIQGMLFQKASKNIALYYETMPKLCPQNEIIVTVFMITRVESSFLLNMEIQIEQKNKNQQFFQVYQQDPMFDMLIEFPQVLTYSIISRTQIELMQFWLIQKSLVILISDQEARYKTKVQLFMIMDYQCPYEFFRPNSISCQSQCLNQNYVHFVNRIRYQQALCRSCNEDCQQCFVQQNYCISCKQPKHLNIFQRRCFTCQSECLVCSVNEICLVCKTKFVIKEGRCVPCSTECDQCATGFILNQNCLLCNVNCLSCVSYQVCLNCKAGFQNIDNICKQKFKDSTFNKFTLQFQCPWPLKLNGTVCAFPVKLGNYQVLKQLQQNLKFYSKFISSVLILVLLFSSNFLLQETLNLFLIVQTLIQFTDYYKSNKIYSFLLFFLKIVTSLQFFDFFQARLNQFIDLIRPTQNSKFIDLVFSPKGKLLIVNSLSLTTCALLILFKILVQILVIKFYLKKPVQTYSIFRYFRKYMKTVFFLFSLNYFKQLYFLTFNFINQINIFFGTLLFCTMMILRLDKRKFDGTVISIPFTNRISDIYLFFQFLGLTVFSKKKSFLLLNSISTIYAVFHKLINRNVLKNYKMQVSKLLIVFYLQLDIIIQFNSQLYVWILNAILTFFLGRGIIGCIKKIVIVIKSSIKQLIALTKKGKNHIKKKNLKSILNIR